MRQAEEEADRQRDRYRGRNIQYRHIDRYRGRNRQADRQIETDAETQRHRETETRKKQTCRETDI